MWKKGWGSYIRVNVYSEEMTDRVEIVKKVINGQTFTGVRFYLKSPEALHNNEGDDDSSAVTFWGKKDLRHILMKAKNLLDEWYGEPMEKE